MLFAAAKNMDFMVGVDLHFGFGFPVHPFFGPVYMWLTPKFPKVSVFINNQPACAVGGTGYAIHIPMVWPPVNPFNLGWFARLFLNIPMVLMTVAVTTLVNSIIALTVAQISPKSDATQEFVQNVTGIDVSSTDSAVKGALGSFKRFTGENWAASWLQLLMSALPFPISNGSPIIGNPTVLVDGAPLGLGVPLGTATCSDIPVIPNAWTIATSNVLVNLSLSQFLMGAATHAVSGIVGMGVGKGMKMAGKGVKKLAGGGGKKTTPSKNNKPQSKQSKKNNKSQAKKGKSCSK